MFFREILRRGGFTRSGELEFKLHNLDGCACGRNEAMPGSGVKRTAVRRTSNGGGTLLSIHNLRYLQRICENYQTG